MNNLKKELEKLLNEENISNSTKILGLTIPYILVNLNNEWIFTKIEDKNSYQNLDDEIINQAKNNPTIQEEFEKTYNKKLLRTSSGFSQRFKDTLEFLNDYIEYKTIKNDEVMDTELGSKKYLYRIKPDKYFEFKKIIKDFYNNKKDIIENLVKYFTYSSDESKENDIENEIDLDNKNISLNQILYGPPGTGKTYNTIQKALEIIAQKENVEIKDRKELKKCFDEYKEKGQIEFITFHQSYGYEEFIEGLKPDIENDNIIYKVQDGIFKELSEKAENDENKNYILIIDEINRGNISKIFGELITLIEDSKRIGTDEEVKIKLPYSSNKPFGVPKNLYIIGTMNTADRSIAQIDTALRRRFEFVEMMPNYNLLNFEVKGIKIDKMLEAINERIEAIYDREHQIGHSYFLSLNENSEKKELDDIFKHKIIPLLAEYFYEDWENIQVILNNNFIKEKEFKYIKSKNKVYEINNDFKIDEYQKIYEEN